MGKITKSEAIRLIKENSNTNYELCQLLDTDADLFRYVPISEIELSAKVRSAIMRCANYDQKVYTTVGSILHLTVSELNRIRNLGPLGQAELLVMIKCYIEQSNYTLRPRNIYAGKDGLRQRRLGHALICLMKNKAHTDISYNRSELAVIEKYKEALAVLEPELCSAAFNCKKPIYDIINALYCFSISRVKRYEYANELEKRIHQLPENIMNSYVHQILIAYYMTGKKPKCDFLFGIDKSVKLINLPKYISVETVRDRDTVHTIDDLLDWLDFDFNVMSEEIMKPLRFMTSYCKEILYSRWHVNKYARLSETTGMSKQKIKSTREKLVHRIAAAYKSSRYNVFVAIYLCSGKLEITYKELCSYIGEEASDTLWKIIKSSHTIMKSEYYSLDRLKCSVTINRN